ncbi:MAG TPA: hypothetical protein VFA98_06105 [Thermoanaerobaculia bacterium]|nr:hypothetical protein [Thermoanaerobaculia bacterium]
MLADPWGQIDRWVNEGGAGLEVGPKPKPVDRANDHGREREDRDPLCKDVL